MKNPLIKLALFLVILFAGQAGLKAQFLFNKIAADPELQEFEEAIIRAGLRNTFEAFGNTYTIFAPTNDVFPTLSPNMTQEAVRQVVLTHCVNGYYKGNHLVNGFSISTMNQRNLTVKKNATGIFINGAKIVKLDVFATNGIMHKIDAFIPISQTTQTTILSLIENSPEHTVLETIIKNAGFDSRYTGTNKITVFAPTDEAFFQLSQSRLDQLLGTNINFIENYLMYHVVNGVIQNNQFQNNGKLTAVNGQTINVTININGTFVNNVKVIFSGLPAANGILYVIKKVLIPQPLPPLTIADYIDQSANHNTLETLVRISGLRPTLAAATPVKTFFAPTDAAFNLLNDAFLDQLTADPTGLLADVLRNHLVNGKFYRVDLLDEEALQAVNGFILKFFFQQNNYFVNNARITTHNIEVDNGLVHVIDAVLAEEPRFTVKNVLENNASLSNFNSYVVDANMDELLDGNGPFTVFAPSNNALVNLPAEIRDGIDNGTIDQIVDFVSNHVVNSELPTRDLDDGIVITARNGFVINVTVQNNNIFLNDSRITIRNQEADNGVVHIIDMALYPEQSPNTIYEYVEANQNHSVLKNAIDEANLEFLYNGSGPLTLFAPTNAAFNLLPDAVLDALFNGPQQDLADLVLRHTLNDDYTSAQLLAAVVLENANLEELSFTTINNELYVNNSKIDVRDIHLDNGTVHVIDAIIVLPEVKNTIMDVVANSSDHTMLEDAIIAAGLMDKYELETSLTLFAPTDNAFNALPSSVLNAILADPDGQLRDLILYHTLEDRVESSGLTNGLVLTTASGEEVEVFIANNNIFINEARISVRDINADNGIVHVMDAVIQPIIVRNTVYDVISNSSNFSTLKSAVDAAGLADRLINETTITLFAPNNNAFQSIPQDTLDALLADPSGRLRDLLEYHLFRHLLPTSSMFDGLNIVMENGEPAIISERFDGFYINDSRLSTPDIPADNGFVHGINSISMPTPPRVTVYDIISSEEELSFLKTAVDAAGLDTELVEADLVTVFAPSDDAFDVIPQDMIDALLADPDGILRSLILYHSYDGLLLSSFLTDGLSIPMNNGESVVVRIDGSDIFINNARITIRDIIADNGVVHVINAVLMREEQERYTVYDVISNNANYSILKDAIDAAGVNTALEEGDMLTVFAPTDQAFYKLGNTLLSQLLSDPNGALAELLLNHTYNGLLGFAEFEDGLELTMEGGHEAVMTLRSDGFYIDDAKIIVANVMADNGIVHMINALVNPPVISSTDELNKAEFTLYPNPANDVLYIKDHSFNSSSVSLKIFDQQGKLLDQITGHNPGNAVDVSRIAQGQYFLYVNDKGSSAVKSFIKVD